MKDNPHRSQAIIVGKSTKVEYITLSLDYNNIICVAYVKLFGDTIDFKLN